jgi:protease-4
MKAISSTTGSSSGIAFTNKVGVIPIMGAIEDSHRAFKTDHPFAKDKSIKAIIPEIDSPGGGVGASQEIYR